jgi:hypothetical protein
LFEFLVDFSLRQYKFIKLCKCKTCDIQTCKKIFPNRSSTNIDTLVPLLHQCIETCKAENLLTVISGNSTLGKTDHRSQKHSPRKRSNGGAAIDYSGGTALRRGAMWHIDPLLGNDCKTKNETMAVARQQPTCNNGGTAGRGVFYVVHYEAISDDRPSSVQFSSVQFNSVSAVE